jgi:hypothetical protein
MKHHAQDQEDLRLYLLGLMAQERQPPLEERLLTDAALYEELLIIEDELIDQYLSGELTARERDSFEAHFMNAPERRRQMLFAGALRSYVADNSTAPAEESGGGGATPERGIEPNAGGRGLLSWLRARNPALAFSLAAVALLLVGGASWVAFRSLLPRTPRQVLTVLLTPGGPTRAGGEVQQVVIPTGVDEVRLKLRLASVESRSYRATLLNAEGTTLFTAERLEPEPVADEGMAVALNVPAEDLPPGDYQLRLSEVAAAAPPASADSYRFRVVRR